MAFLETEQIKAANVWRCAECNSLTAEYRRTRPTVCGNPTCNSSDFSGMEQVWPSPDRE